MNALSTYIVPVAGLILRIEVSIICKNLPLSLLLYLSITQYIDKLSNSSFMKMHLIRNHAKDGSNELCQDVSFFSLQTTSLFLLPMKEFIASIWTKLRMLKWFRYVKVMLKTHKLSWCLRSQGWHQKSSSRPFSSFIISKSLCILTLPHLILLDNIVLRSFCSVFINHFHLAPFI